VSVDFRLKLSLKPTDPLAPKKLARHLRAIVLVPADIAGLETDVLDQLLVDDSSAWSAVTLVRGQQTVVIVNSAHSPARQSNNTMHELAHLICGHRTTPATVSDDGLLILREYDASQEEEADLLAATLLLPRVALVHIMESQWDLPEAASHYQVSRALLEMRLRRAGVYMQFERRRKLPSRH
jgi:Zn-dependent peptidase ImmA (M78 family)